VEFIQLKDVTKVYAQKEVLKDVNITINEGDIFCIIGKSGSGKTTLLNLISGLIAPTKGEAVYFSRVDQHEKNLHKNIHHIKKHIGFTPQNTSFYDKLTVKENLLHFGKMYGIKKATLINNAKSLLQFMQLLEHRDKLASHLSGGMRKRLDIACSLVHKPKILLLDEPTSDLDPVLQKEILTMLREVNKQGVTIVFATNQLETAEEICSKLAVIHDGKVYSQGTLDEIRNPYIDEYFTIRVQRGEEKATILNYLRQLPINKVIDEGQEIKVYPDDIAVTLQGLLHIIKSENLNLHNLDIRKPFLREVFEKIVKSNNKE